MPTDADPVAGTWYQNLGKGQKFEVVALDPDNALVDIQYFDGDTDEIGLEEWYGLDIEPIEAPEDWTGPVNDVERDDLGYTETGMESEDWAAGTSEIKKPGDTSGEEEREDKPGEGYPEEDPWGGED